MIQVLGIVLVLLPVETTVLVNLAGAACVGFGSSIQQNSLNSLASSLPGYTIGATMAGQGVAGILTAAFSPFQPGGELTAAIFIIAIVLTVATIPLYKCK